MLVNPSVEYEKRVEYNGRQVKKYAHMIDTISTSRLITFILAAAAAVYFYIHKSYAAIGWDFALFIILFIPLVIIHQKYIDKKAYYTALFDINAGSLKRIKGKWKDFDDTGNEFIDEGHSYSNDLDIFGEGSLFQYINTTVTHEGRNLLAKLLAGPDKSKGDIIKRQNAVDELAQKLDFRQNIQAQGMLSKGEMIDIKNLVQWANKKYGFYRNPSVVFIFSVFPGITICAGLFYIFSGSIPGYVPLMMLIFQFLLLGLFKMDERRNMLATAYKYSDSIKLYSNMLEHFEKESFKSLRLLGLQQSLKNPDGIHAYRQIRKLDSIVDFISNRQSMLYIVFDILFLLDYQFVFSLERWKRLSGKNIKQWFDAIGEVEALCSLSVLRFDNPGWCFPEICENRQVFAAENMGHPLLGKDCITNSISFKSPVSVLLITGSNMSGKSTFLRTAGINLVLSYAGAPVYAGKFCCSIMDIHTCMKIKDNLDKNISSFYAELLRIKSIVQAVDNGKPVFFLLDEIFKGTNSIDRHTGASILIKKLCVKNVIGFVSTHDLELGDMEKENTQIRNYHFQEHYIDNNICFDYKLYPGISTTRNALHLMKLAGIEIPDDKLY